MLTANHLHVIAPYTDNGRNQGEPSNKAPCNLRQYPAIYDRCFNLLPKW